MRMTNWLGGDWNQSRNIINPIVLVVGVMFYIHRCRCVAPFLVHHNFGQHGYMDIHIRIYVWYYCYCCQSLKVEFALNALGWSIFSHNWWLTSLPQLRTPKINYIEEFICSVMCVSSNSFHGATDLNNKWILIIYRMFRLLLVHHIHIQK